ncbi:tagatose-bisphosphate aldolase [Erysipelothrix larvae]|uniref:Tagatose-bisphosphate aldolase n=1 Tax=Erysipelothrix larvae TaxID=1514105 RepID=A0A0X8H0U0_9FIRM|nr:class II D-tagatose-bisphosphate aldolase, non-catalytic subunit [Erysipelothrix larvae]AMC93794.1 tagatose-bisphosphate aldolase [Erysipelothrix larvae]
MSENILLKLTNKHPVGVYSVCTASGPVIKASLEFAKENGSILVVEATANQVNQFGGYTNMTPSDYREFVYDIAHDVGFDPSRIVLGGDHLGPLTWTDKDEAEAMALASTLVYEYAKAGYTKIHLDTSMKVASDSASEPLSNTIIAQRSCELAKAALRGYNALKESNPDAVFPVFIIGSEVPIPGGAQEAEESLAVTTVEDFMTTYLVFKDVYQKENMMKVFNHVIAIVVQPGVEFGDSDLFIYQRENAKKLTTALKENFETLNFEGHSTDYQTPSALREMVEDGITILKVGPALTFAYREVLFALSEIERILFSTPSHLPDVLEKAMLDNPKNWEKHYHGNTHELAFKRKYSYSDRARYYLPVPEVDTAIQTLIHNLESIDIPETLLSQYLPYQYRHVKDGLITKHPHDLISDYIKLYLADYEYATQSAKL